VILMQFLFVNYVIHVFANKVCVEVKAVRDVSVNLARPMLNIF